MKFTERIAVQRYLFLSIILFLLISPLFDSFPGSRWLLYITLSLIAITGPLAIAKHRLQVVFTITVGLLMVTPGLIAELDGSLLAYRASALLGVIFFSYVSLVLAQKLMFHVGEVTDETLWGAVNIYLTIGIAFAFLYATVSFFDPEAFVGTFVGQDLLQRIEAFVYFSFVSMTTLGYGDITPNNAFVATLAYLQAVLGQMYVAIMIARLVGLHIATRK